MGPSQRAHTITSMAKTRFSSAAQSRRQVERAAAGFRPAVVARLAVFATGAAARADNGDRI